MTIVLTPDPPPIPPSFLRQLSTSSAKSNASRPAVGDWIVRVTQQNVMSLEEACEVHSLETLQTSISDGLRAIGNAWNDIESMVAIDADEAPLPTHFAPVNDLIGRINAASCHYGEGLAAIDPLIKGIDKALERIYRSREAPWGSWKSIGSQKTIRAGEGLTVNATAAFKVLYHLDHAVQDVLSTLLAVRCMEVQNAATTSELSQDSEGPTKGGRQKCTDELVDVRQLSVAARRAGRALNQIGPVIDNALIQASAAMPPERRRWKVRIAILVGLFLLSATLIAATIVLPQLFPTLVIIGMALKIASGLLSGLSLVNSVFTLVAYPRNQGWNDMAACIEKVRNLYRSMNLRIRDQQEAVCEREEDILRRKISACGVEIQLANARNDNVLRTLNDLNQVMAHASI